MRQLSRLELDRRYAPAEAVAQPLEGLPISAYAHSLGYVGLTVPAGGTLYPYCSVNYIDRLQRRLRNPAGVPGNNNAVAGAQANGIALYAMTSQTAASRKGTAAAGTWVPSALPSGVVILDTLGNDVIHYASQATGAKGIAGFQNSLDALIRYLRAQAITQDTAAAFAYGAGWTSAASSAVPGGNVHSATAQNAAVTITTPVGTDFDLVILGWDDAVVAAPGGAAYTVTVDGGAVPNFAWNPGTTSNQCKQDLAVGVGFNNCPIAIPLRGLSNAAHTVVLTKTGADTRYLYVSQLLTASPTPPTLVVMKMGYFSTAGYASTSVTKAEIDQFNAYVDTIAARFPNDGSVIVIDPNANGWDPTTMVSSQDSNSIHPNDRGMQCYADMITRALNKLPTRQGLQIL